MNYLKINRFCFIFVVDKNFANDKEIPYDEEEQ